MMLVPLARTQGAAPNRHQTDISGAGFDGHDPAADQIIDPVIYLGQPIPD
jgi:hypothetical protein